MQLRKIQAVIILRSHERNIHKFHACIMKVVSALNYYTQTTRKPDLPQWSDMSDAEKATYYIED